MFFFSSSSSSKYCLVEKSYRTKQNKLRPAVNLVKIIIYYKLFICLSIEKTVWIQNVTIIMNWYKRIDLRELTNKKKTIMNKNIFSININWNN